MPSPSRFLLAAALLLVAFSAFSQPANDDCSSAVTLNVDPGENCAGVVSGSTDDATFSGVDFCSTPVKDVWYSFVATAGAHTISLTNVSDTIGNSNAIFFTELFSGNCATLDHLACTPWFYGQGSIRFGDLIPGNTYYIRVANPYDQVILFDICLSTPPAPPANDACVGALALAVDGGTACNTPFAGSTAGATGSPVPAGCNTCYWADDDVWFTFTATQPNHSIRISNIAMANDPNTPDALYINVFDGSCGNFTLLQTFDYYGNDGSRVLTNLTPGETYYIRLFSVFAQQGITFDICISSPLPPPNDECAGAVAVTANPGLTCDTYFFADSQPATPSGTNCEGGTVNDVWYKFLVTSPAHRIQFGSTPYGFEAYTGICNNLTPIQCGPGFDQNNILNGLVPGDTCYLRVFNPPYTFYDFYGCIQTLPLPPANDECSNAESIPVNGDINCNLQTNGTTLGATSSAQNCTGDESTHDVWYSFVANSTSHRIDVTQNYTIFGEFVFGYEIFGGNCDNLVSLKCQPYNYEPAILTGLTPGDTYRIRVYSNAGDAHNFNICIRTLPPPPANVDCSVAEVLTPAPTPACAVVTPGTTSGIASESSTMCFYGNGMDVWYSFVATEASHIVRITDVQSLYGGSEFWAEVYESSDCNNLMYKECYIYPGAFYLNDLSIGTTYYIRWVSAPYGGHSFNICIGTFPPPPNDNCNAATPLQVDSDLACDNPVSGTTGGSTSDAQASCFNNGDVWYSFTATQAAHQIALSNVFDPENVYPQYFQAELLSGECGNFSTLQCWVNAFYGSGALLVGDLTPGETYYLRIGSPGNTPINFDICVLTPPPPPANDACANATVLTPEQGNTCNATVTGTTLDATSSPGVPYLCCNAGDVWYAFTATQANYVISMPSIVSSQFNYPETVVLELYAMACDTFVFKGQTGIYSGGSWYLTHLEPGQTYHVRLYNQNPYYGAGINFEICVLAPVPPVNDECAGALPLPLNTDLVCNNILTANTFGATQSLNSSCYYFADNDLWYQFTANTPSYRFEINLLNGLPGQFGYELIGGNCNDLSTLRCESLFYNSVFTLDGLTVGDVYYLRLTSQINSSHEISVCALELPFPPANDACATAEPIAVSPDLNCTTPVSGTTLGATQSLEACYGASSQDVWYSFTATGPSQLLELAVTNTYFFQNPYMGFQLLEGDCNNPAGLLCQEFYGQTLVVLQGLTTGQTYYIRVFSPGSNAHDFSLCLKTLPPPPPNDDCAQATPVTPNEATTCDLTYPGTTVSATNSGFGPLDVWYSFTAGSNSHIIAIQNIVTVFGSTSSLYFDIYQGDDCDNLIPLAGGYWAHSVPALFTFFEPGQTYYIRVWSNDVNSAYNFDLCIQSLPPSPPNETCEGAIELTPNPDLDCNIVASGSTAGAINYDYPYCAGGNDVWYQFTAIASNHIIEISNLAAILGYGSLWVEVWQGPDCANLNLITCTYFNLYNNQPMQLSSLTPGQVYYIKTASEYGTAHNFDLCIKTIPPPPNDLCANAASLDAAPEQYCTPGTSGTTYGAGASGLSPCGYDGADVWYSFTATQASHTLTINNVLDAQGNYPTSFGVEIFGGDCGNLQNLYCRHFVYYSDQFTFGDLVAGQVYYVRVLSYSGSINFDLCIGTPPPPPANDACSNAVNLPVSPDETCVTSVSGTTANATPSQNPGANYQFNDVWFQFTATQANHFITVNTITPYSYLTVEILDGTCGSFNVIGEQYVYYYNPFLLTNLVPGTTYYLRVYEGYNQPTDFEICITSLPAPPNDECAGAISLDVNPDLTCAFNHAASTYGATQSAAGCSGNAVNDVWYSFTASGTSQRLDIAYSSGVVSNYYFGMEIYEGSCGALTTVMPCAEYYYSLNNNTLQNLTPGNTYYIRLYTLQGNFMNFDICIRTLPDPPSNDECAQATTIEANSGVDCALTYTGSTLGATQSQTSCYGYNTHDVWYQFTAASVTHLIELQETGNPLGYPGFLGMQVYSGNDCMTLISYQCLEYVAGNPPVVMSGLTVGETYFIRVFSQYNSAHDFSLCIRTLPPPPANNVCSGAQVVVPNPGQECTEPVSATTAGLLDYYYYGCYGGPNLWYQFTATSNTHLIELQNIVNQYGYSFLGFELYQGTCEGLQLLQCAYDGGQIYSSNLVVGNTYYIRVAGAQNSGMAFDLCVLTITPPANDDCANATSLSVSPTSSCETLVSGTTLGATLSNVSGACSFTADVWYSFTATGTAHTVVLNNVSGGNYYELIYEVFSGDCGGLSSLGCYTAYSLSSFNDLTPGNTYYVRVGTYTQSIFDFDLCIGTSLPDLVPVYLAVNAGNCGLGSNETVQAVFYNQGTATVPANAAVYNLSVSGVNNGNYGPLTNDSPIPPGLYGFVEFTGVDLSVPGLNQLVVTGTAPGDPTYEEYGIFFTGLPLETFYYDADGDGYGDPGNIVTSCYQYEWLVTNDDDCDDYNFYVNPAATEFCNGYDDNCNGLTDAEDPGVLDTLPPVANCPPDTILVNDPGICAALVSYEVSAWDECSFTLTQTAGIASGEEFPVGTTVNTFTASDAAGNQATCSFTVEVQKTGDPDLLYAYTVIGLNEVTMKQNTVQSGGVGVVNANKKAILQLNTAVTAPNTFVKAPVLQLQGGSQVSTYYQGQVASGLLPAFQPNNNPGNNNVTIPNNNAPVVLNLNNYGKITVGNNVTVTFSGHNTVEIKELTIGNDATILFDQGTAVLIDKKMDVGKNTDINPGGGQFVQFFAEGNVSIGKGSDVSANIYTEKNLSLEKASAETPTYMTGLFIADKVDAKEHTYWNWDATYCPFGEASRPITSGEQATSRSPLHTSNGLTERLTLLPNPASEEVRISFEGTTNSEATVQLFDATGRLTRNEKFMATTGPNQYRLDLAGLPEGLYTVQVLAGARQAVEKLVIVKR